MQSDPPHQVAASRRNKPSDWTQFTGKGIARTTARSQSKLRHVWPRRGIRKHIGSSSESRRHLASAASTQAALCQLHQPEQSCVSVRSSSTRANVPSCIGDDGLPVHHCPDETRPANSSSRTVCRAVPAESAHERLWKTPHNNHRNCWQTA